MGTMPAQTQQPRPSRVFLCWEEEEEVEEEVKEEEVGSGRQPARVTRAVPSEERPTVSPIVHTFSPKFATTTTFSNRMNLILIQL